MSKVFSERLTALRKERYSSQAEGGEALGVSGSRYNKWETDTNNPDYEMVCKIADHYGVTTDYLLGRTNSRKPIADFEGNSFEKGLHVAINNSLMSFLTRFSEYEKDEHALDLRNPVFVGMVGFFNKIVETHMKLIEVFKNHASVEEVDKSITVYVESLDSLGMIHVGGEVDKSGALIDGLSTFEIELWLRGEAAERIDGYADYHEKKLKRLMDALEKGE